MKKLKLDHRSAQLVLQGKLHTTWRLFDDKDLTVGETVELVDKVEPDHPQTWSKIGFATIRSIVEKPFKDIRSQDMEGIDISMSLEDAIEHYRKYYGQNVDDDTIVKILRFDFESTEPSEQVKQSAMGTERLKLYADGGSRGNPGPSAGGYVIFDGTGVLVVHKGFYLGITTNNQAEYTALKRALEEARALKAKEVDVYMDSLLVINQLKGIFKVKNRDLWPIHDSIKQLCTQFVRVSFTQVPRELNKLADAAVNQALDEALGIS